MKWLLVPAVLLINSAFAQVETDYTQYKLLADDGAGKDFFGFDVAIDGNTALVGAFKADHPSGAADVGAAYVYARTQQGWQPQAKLMTADGLAGDSFGGRVALSGHVAAIGAIGHGAVGPDAGAVYVFNRAGSSWKQQAKLLATDGAAGDAFGQSLAIAGDTLVIGAPHDDVHGESSGSVYLFNRVAGSWQQHMKLTAPDGAAGDVFGISLDLDGDTLLIGADLHDAQAMDAGAAYVFVRDVDTWRLQDKLMADDGGQTDLFGVRVALSGDTALISARRDDDERMGVDAGSAYVFVRQGDQWQQQAKLTAPDGAADDRFGQAVAIEGDQAVISAMHQDDLGANSGAVYVYVHQQGVWQFQSKHTASDGAAGDLFGWAVSMSGQGWLVGATRHDQAGQESGAAYLFETVTQ
ncbi:FG-GAP repeat protein [Marinicella meishanensis]|uniref:FG-GAP repeat protein n=1 Tax=Marinicella meishanensis TaxID=2873263 RepID=UPI001CBC56CE|nr:FG-GAP repeat protein [Marinicella sp. NBU2979]